MNTDLVGHIAVKILSTSFLYWLESYQHTMNLGCLGIRNLRKKCLHQIGLQAIMWGHFLD